MRKHYCVIKEEERKAKDVIFTEVAREDLDNSKEMPGDKYWTAIATSPIDNEIKDNE